MTSEQQSIVLETVSAKETIDKKTGVESKQGSQASLVQTLMVLFKMRVVALLVFAAVGGAFLGASGWPGLSTLLLVIVTGGLTAMGASAINQYVEQDSDRQMNRTKHRPLASGTFEDTRWVPWVATAMIVLPILVVLPFNQALAFFLGLGAFIYVVIYTIWLKPRTLLNIVIGGAAGSAAVLAGAAAAGNWSAPGALVLALLVFVWTPTHFWSLAIVYRNDYARSDLPMLPVSATPRQSAFWVLVHTLATALAALVLVFDPALGLLYFVPVALATVDLVYRNVKLLRDPSGNNARALFMASNIYLAVVLLMICVDATITAL
ncbi:MAG: heme o synthase [Chloroflexota bacterium]|nr:heme o synthase [Chloroflexota bacterium]